MGKKPRLGTRAKVLIETKEELLGHISHAFNYYVAKGRIKERFGHTLDRIGVESAFEEIFSGEVQKNDWTNTACAAVEAKNNFLDLRGVFCPLNFVKAKLAMEKMGSGEIIEFYLDDGEPIVNVSRSLKDEGHQIMLVIPKESYFKLMVKKNDIQHSKNIRQSNADNR